MAIRDAQNQFCAAQAMPSSSTTTASTNAIDLGISKGLNTNKPLMLYMLWGATALGTSLNIQLVSSASSTITSSPRIHWETGVVVAANYVTLGMGINAAPTLIALPHSFFNPSLGAGSGATAPYLQYLGLLFVSIGDNHVGTLTSGLVEAMDMRTYAASGYAAP